MCDSTVKSMLKKFVEEPKRLQSVKAAIEIFQKEDYSQEEIIINLLKSIASIGGEKRIECLESFRWILESMSKKFLLFTQIKLKEFLFQDKIKDATKGELASNKLGSLLTFDALLSNDLSKFDKNNLKHFYKYILSLISDNALGFLTSMILIKYYKRVSITDFQTMSIDLKDDLFKLENLDNHPQYLLLWLSFSNEQTIILDKSSKNMLSITSKEFLNKLPNLFKVCKADQLKSLLGYVICNSNFSDVWKFFYDDLLKNDTQCKNKRNLQLILSISFEVVFPEKNGVISQLSKEKRLTLLNQIWSKSAIIELLLKQLSATDYVLYGICKDFVLKITSIENDKENYIFENLFNNALKFVDEFVKLEAHINLSVRFSNSLFRYVKSRDDYNIYVQALEKFVKDSENWYFTTYAIEQMSLIFVKCSVREQSDLATLIQINYENYKKKSDIKIIESAKHNLLKCFTEISANLTLDKLKNLLTICDKIYENNEHSNVFKDVLKFWDTSASKSKKRTSQLNEEVVDLTNKINEMFVTLLSHICFYMVCIPYDEDFLEIIQDINSCFKESRGILYSDTCSKRVKRIDDPVNDDNDDQKNWKIILTDVLIVLMEQNCYYLRSVADTAFKTIVTEGLCEAIVIEHIDITLKESRAQSRNLDRVIKDNHNASEEKIGSDCESFKSDEEENMNYNKEDSNIKSRIFSALESVNADINSDADENYPEDDSMQSVEEISKKKVSLKEKRHTILQLRQFRNRCIDLLETVLVYAPKIDDRLLAFTILLGHIHKSDHDVENRLMKSMNAFKKHNPKQTMTVQEIIKHINILLEAAKKCNLSKETIQIFSTMIVVFLRFNKSEITFIAQSFKPIIDQCILTKSKHPLKAVFLETFDKFPEISWVFQDQLLKYIGSDQTEQVQFQAISILRKIVSNTTIKAIVKNPSETSFVDKGDVLLFVNKFGELMRSLIVKIDIQSHPKNSSLILGSLVDCLKLGGNGFYEVMGEEVYNKVKELMKIKEKPIHKDFKKIMNQFIAAVDCAKKFA